MPPGGYYPQPTAQPQPQSLPPDNGVVYDPTTDTFIQQTAPDPTAPALPPPTWGAMAAAPPIQAPPAPPPTSGDIANYNLASQYAQGNMYSTGTPQAAPVWQSYAPPPQYDPGYQPSLDQANQYAAGNVYNTGGGPNQQAAWLVDQSVPYDARLGGLAGAPQLGVPPTPIEHTPGYLNAGLQGAAYNTGDAYSTGPAAAQVWRPPIQVGAPGAPGQGPGGGVLYPGPADPSQLRHITGQPPAPPPDVTTLPFTYPDASQGGMAGRLANHAHYDAQGNWEPSYEEVARGLGGGVHGMGQGFADWANGQVGGTLGSFNALASMPITGDGTADLLGGAAHGALDALVTPAAAPADAGAATPAIQTIGPGGSQPLPQAASSTPPLQSLANDIASLGLTLPGIALPQPGSLSLGLSSAVNPTQGVPAYTSPQPRGLGRLVPARFQSTAPTAVPPTSLVGSYTATNPQPATTLPGVANDVLGVGRAVLDTLGAAKDQIAGPATGSNAAPARPPAAASSNAALPVPPNEANSRTGLRLGTNTFTIKSTGATYPVIEIQDANGRAVWADNGDGTKVPLITQINPGDGFVDFNAWKAKNVPTSGTSTTNASGDTTLPVDTGTVVASGDSGGSGGGSSGGGSSYHKSYGGSSGSSSSKSYGGSGSSSHGSYSGGGSYRSNQDGIYHVTKSDGSRVTVDLNNLPDEVKSNDAFMSLLKKDPSAAAKLLADHGYGLSRSGKVRGARARKGLAVPASATTTATNGRSGPLANAIFDRYFEVANKPIPPAVAKAVVDSLPVTSDGGASAGKRSASTGNKKK